MTLALGRAVQIQDRPTGMSRSSPVSSALPKRKVRTIGITRMRTRLRRSRRIWRISFRATWPIDRQHAHRPALRVRRRPGQGHEDVLQGGGDGTDDPDDDVATRQGDSGVRARRSAAVWRRPAACGRRRSRPLTPPASREPPRPPASRAAASTSRTVLAHVRPALLRRAGPDAAVPRA